MQEHNLTINFKFYTDDSERINQIAPSDVLVSLDDNLVRGIVFLALRHDVNAKSIIRASFQEELMRSTEFEKEIELLLKIPNFKIL